MKVNENQPEYIYDERREQIKRVALKLFAYRGITGTKMSMIADEAGISQGLSYRYFSSKEELFTELIQEAMDESQSAIKNIHHLPGTPTEQIRALTKIMLDESHKYYFLLVQQEQTSEGVPERTKQVLEQYSSKDTIDQLLPIFIKGQQTGEFCAGDPFRLLLLYFSVISGLILQGVHSEANWLEEVDSLMKILMK